jgi:hypothetical protein
MADEASEIEFSPLSRQVARDGVVVDMKIYRLRSAGDLWSLEVADQENTCTIWTEDFSTDQEAYQTFVSILEKEGIHSFVDEPSSRRQH